MLNRLNPVTQCEASCVIAQAHENDSAHGNQAASAFRGAASKAQGNARRNHAAQEERDHVRLQKERIRRLEADVGARDRRIKELEQQSLVSCFTVRVCSTFTCTLLVL